MSGKPARVLIAGISVRAMAQSAARAGYEVTAIDAFGDLDTLQAAHRALTPRRDLDRPFSAARLAALAREVPAEFLCYGSTLENYPRTLADLMRRRHLLGNAPGVLRRVRDPLHLTRTLRRNGFAAPRTRATPAEAGSWLLKPRRSGGGRGIVPWTRGSTVPRARYLQERVRGIPGSMAFSADGRRLIPLAVSRQLIGIRSLGARDFMYAGSILAPVDDPQFPHASALFARVQTLAEAVVEEFGLLGVNGIDFVARDGVPFPVEVNPRYSASLELAERAYGISVFQMHASGCLDQLPRSALLPRRFLPIGKAIVYARRRVTLGDTRPWLEDASLADIPWPGEQVAAGHPICTVFATAATALECERRLLARAERVYGELSRPRGRAA